MTAKPREQHCDPPGWAQGLLRLLLPKRDQDTVAGDLLEEYREVILPTRGPLRARLWYVKQVLSFANSVTFGVALGALLGVWNLIDTAIWPLSEDTPVMVGGMLAVVLLLLSIPAIAVRRRGGRLIDAVRAGATTGVIVFALLHVFAVVRVNVFLDTIRHRSDWQGLIWRFQRSGFHSLRLYANYVYARQMLLIPLIGAVGGTVSGAIGGLLGGARSR